MATAIPNFYRAQSPLGASVQGLASILMNQPSADERAAIAGQLALQQQSLADAQEKARVSAQQQGARSKLGDLLADPRLYDPLYRREPLAPPPETGDLGVTSTPIHRAALPDFGEITRQGIAAGLDPEKLGGYVLFGSANANGMRDTRTQNAQVGAGQQYGNVAEAFDIGETNKIAINDADNQQSAANADLQAKTSIRNNNADNSTRLRIAEMTDDRADAREGLKQQKVDAKDQEAARQRAATADVVLGKIAEARSIIGGSTLPTGGFVGKKLADNVPGTDAYTLDRTVDTIKANLGFEQLAAMRAASPTGGALGNVTEKELAMLQATVSSLDSGLPTDQKLKNLEDIERHYNNVKMLQQGKLPKEYQGGAPAAAPAAPAQGGWKVERQ